MGLEIVMNDGIQISTMDTSDQEAIKNYMSIRRLKMSKRLPTYTIDQIAQILALGIVLGYDKLSKEESEMLDNLANDLFILDDKTGGD